MWQGSGKNWDNKIWLYVFSKFGAMVLLQFGALDLALRPSAKQSTGGLSVFA